jgi:hypothetical protein
MDVYQQISCDSVAYVERSPGQTSLNIRYWVKSKGTTFSLSTRNTIFEGFRVCVTITVPSLVPQGRLTLAQDVSPGNLSNNSASPAGTAETAGNGFGRACGTELGTVVLTRPAPEHNAFPN